MNIKQSAISIIKLVIKKLKSLISNQHKLIENVASITNPNDDSPIYFKDGFAIKSNPRPLITTGIYYLELLDDGSHNIIRINKINNKKVPQWEDGVSVEYEMTKSTLFVNLKSKKDKKIHGKSNGKKLNN